MLTPGDEIIRYDGQTMALTTNLQVQIEAHRGRRWGWFGKKGWWVHLYLFQGWHMRRFVSTLSEAGVFLKQDAEMHPRTGQEKSASAPDFSCKKPGSAERASQERRSSTTSEST